MTQQFDLSFKLVPTGISLKPGIPIIYQNALIDLLEEGWYINDIYIPVSSHENARVWLRRTFKEKRHFQAELTLEYLHSIKQ